MVCVASSSRGQPPTKRLPRPRIKWLPGKLRFSCSESRVIDCRTNIRVPLGSSLWLGAVLQGVTSHWTGLSGPWGYQLTLALCIFEWRLFQASPEGCLDSEAAFGAFLWRQTDSAMGLPAQLCSEDIQTHSEHRTFESPCLRALKARSITIWPPHRNFMFLSKPRGWVRRAVSGPPGAPTEQHSQDCSSTHWGAGVTRALPCLPASHLSSWLCTLLLLGWDGMRGPDLPVCTTL